MEITGQDIANALERAARRLIEIRDHLNELDGKMGDGDCGITAEKGANGLLGFLHTNPPGEDLGRWLGQAGMAYNKAAPSSMGTLIATALMRAGKEVMGRASVDQPTLANMLMAANLGMQERGKAKPGDKTIIDAVHPAATAFQNAIESSANLETASQAMLEAARKGRDDAIPLRSMIGRANWVGERTEGLVDPGTVLFVSALEAVLGIVGSSS
jgi:dihydroxyacetone kinase